MKPRRHSGAAKTALVVGAETLTQKLMVLRK